MDSMVTDIGNINECLVPEVLLDIQIPLLRVGRGLFGNIGHDGLAVNNAQVVGASAHWS